MTAVMHDTSMCERVSCILLSAFPRNQSRSCTGLFQRETDEPMPDGLKPFPVSSTFHGQAAFHVSMIMYRTGRKGRAICRSSQHKWTWSISPNTYQGSIRLNAPWCAGALQRHGQRETEIHTHARARARTHTHTHTQKHTHTQQL